MKKTTIFLVFMIFQSALFAKDYNCSFFYKVATSSGQGKCSEGKEPVVKVDLENKEIAFPDFVFTDSKTIPEYSVKDIECIFNENGIIEIKKDSFEVNQNGKTIIGKKLQGTINGDELNLEVSIKVGKMPFDMKIKYFTGD